MTVAIRSVTVVGAGAMGCYFAARFAEAGLAVTVVDIDQRRLDLIAREGILVSDDAGNRTVPVAAMLAGAVTGPVDLVMLFTKGMHSRAAIGSVAHLAKPDTLAVTLQNGLGNAEIVAGVFAAEAITVGMTDVPVDLDGPNRVSSYGKAHIVIGGHVAGENAGAERVARALVTAGFHVEVLPNVIERIWEKVAFNAAMNAIATIAQCTVGGLNNEPARRLIAAVVAETEAVASALGIRIDHDLLTAKIANALATHRAHKPSMLQDRLSGRPTEIETINGAIVRAAQSVGLTAPVNATLADIVRLLECAPAD